jgi:hypothetical protein
METNHLPRHEFIESLLPPHGQKVADAAILLWEQMAAQLILIVGDEGFDSLYGRSLSLSRSTFPWLAGSSSLPPDGQRFAELKMSLEDQTPEQAIEANHLLLTTFTDVLASLIGEQLTTRILRLAWSTDISNSTGKEFQK